MTTKDEGEYETLATQLKQESDPEKRAAIRKRMRAILDRLLHYGEADPRFLDPQLYDQWKRKLAGDPKPHNVVEHLSTREKLAMALADTKLKTKDRADPVKNPNLFPEKEIVIE